VRRYLRSPSTRLAAAVGAITFVSYALAHTGSGNATLVGVALLIGVFLPSYARLSNQVEVWTNNRFGFVTAGRRGRFIPQYVFNLVVFGVMWWGGALDQTGVASVGGVGTAALVTSLASQGAQYVGAFLFQRGVGDMNRNVLVGLSVNTVLTALGTAGVPFARELFLVVGLSLGALVFGVGLLSDIRSLVAPKGGVGVYFGTFNPFHNSHLGIVRRAIEERGLEKVVIHPTILPRVFAQAFRSGEIEVARLDRGYQIWATTAKADVNVDYFPTGRMFLAPPTRRALIEVAIAEAGLTDKVEVAFYPEIYEARGFQGVIAEVRRRHPGKRLHGLHGTDFGGMTVRNIYDECGWIYPWRIMRRDDVSATAIRAGRGEHMTSGAVSEALAQLGAGAAVVKAGERCFANVNGELRVGT